ncbi:MAG: DUF1828 domain-containing protein [Spirosomataceae bacterium]
MDFQRVIDDYLKWIKDNTVVRTIEEGSICSITTPFLDRHNDHLDIFVLKQGDKIKLTDDGYTIADLKMSGLDINTPKRESILRTTLNGFGVKLNGNDELFVEATQSNVGQKKHYLLQAILTVNDMFNLASETVQSLFKEDVELYFRTNDIYYSKDIKIAGKSGYDHNIDFLVTATRTKPERLIKTVNTPKKDSALASIMAFTDIMREPKTKNYVLYNDIEKNVNVDFLGALDSYGIKSIAWSEKEQFKNEFSLN